MFSIRLIVASSALCLIAFLGACGSEGPSEPDLSPPPTPMNLVASPVGISAVELSWTKLISNETRFHIERRAEPDPEGWESVGTAPSGSSNFTDSDLRFGGTVFYRIQACNDAGCSGFSNEASAEVPIVAAQLDGIKGVGACATYRDWVELEVYVGDQFGNPMEGVRIDWSVTKGGGSVEPASSWSDPQGIATTGWTPGPEVYIQGVAARLDETRQVDFVLFSGNPTLSGQLFTPDGGELPVLEVVAGEGGDGFSARVESDRTFSLLGPAGFDSIVLVLDAPAGVVRSYHPSLLKLPNQDHDSLRIVLVPLTWTIPSGTYEGVTAWISMDAAFDHAEYTSSSFYKQRWATDSSAWSARIQSWPTDSYPIPVVLRRDWVGGGAVIDASDSIGLWALLDEMEQDYGADLFQPIQWKDVQTTDAGRPLNVITIKVDTAQGASTGGASFNSGDPSVGWGADLDYGHVTARSSPDRLSSYVMIHEMVHAMGFGHACRWESAVRTCSNQYYCSQFPGGNVDRVSAYDVAYMQVMSAVRETQKAHLAPFGIPEAFAGERVVMLELPPYHLPQPAPDP